MIALAINISAGIAFLAAFALPVRWMLAAWVYCAVALMSIKLFYPEYWAELLAKTVPF